MRLPRPRCTIRRLMILVALVGLLLWLFSVRNRWSDYGRQARSHEELANVLRAEADLLRKRGLATKEVEVREEAMREEFRQARRYRRAQARPWLPIASVPLEPE